MIYRVIAYVSIFCSIIFLPYWFYVLIMAAAIIVLPFFWEAILFGFLIDTLYGPGASISLWFLSIYALAAALALLAMLLVKERLRFHV